jgi:Xaa-Pro aminopeptidase
MLIDLARARQLMERHELEALVAASPENVHYASDFADPYTHVVRSNLSFALIPRDHDPCLIINEAEADFARRESWIDDHLYYDSEIYVERSKKPSTIETPAEALAVALRNRDLDDGAIAVDFRELRGHQQTTIEQALEGWTLQEGTDIFYELRSVKTADEIERLRKATAATDAGITTFFEKAAEGVSERELKQEVEHAVIDADGEVYRHHPGHITLAAGTGSGTPISPPSEYIVQSGDIVRMDLGAIYEGYTSDIARVGTIGQPSEKASEYYSVVCEAQEAMLGEVKPGTRASDIFETGQKYVQEHGFPDFERGVLGHGVGLQNHEPPYIGPNNDRELEPGMVLAIELPYYVEGWGGFNVEDVCLVTETGYDLLTDLEKELIAC